MGGDPAWVPGFDFSLNLALAIVGIEGMNQQMVAVLSFFLPLSYKLIWKLKKQNMKWSQSARTVHRKLRLSYEDFF